MHAHPNPSMTSPPTGVVSVFPAPRSTLLRRAGGHLSQAGLSEPRCGDVYRALLRVETWSCRSGAPFLNPFSGAQAQAQKSTEGAQMSPDATRAGKAPEVARRSPEVAGKSPAKVPVAGSKGGPSQ